VKIAIFESIVTPAGHEHDFDKMLVSELQDAGHTVEFLVPQNYPFKVDYGVSVRHLPGEAVSYAGASGLQKMLLAAKREIRRLKWFDKLYEYLRDSQIDALIIPTATYRFLRTIRRSRLKDSPVPVIPILHGVNNKEAERFFRQATALERSVQMKIAVITLGDDLFGRQRPNITCLKPPVFRPPLLTGAVEASEEPPVLGFFGQYRREKNLEGFLTVFGCCQFSQPVKLFVQGATILPEDAADFIRLQQKYVAAPNIEFLHKALIGEEWQQAIVGVDALIMPYSADRYRYHWSAMLFTAIGYHKPVIVADSINPEILAHYDIGVSFRPDHEEELKGALERFVNTYPEKKQVYRAELNRANTDFAPAGFVRSILDMLDERTGG
jgi:glycosyltransferase involved in cell wall biosynthesis